MATIEKKGYVETTNLKSTIVGNIYSVKSSVELENGMALKLKEMNITSAPGIYEVEKAGSADKMALMADVVIIYSETTKEASNEYNYVIPAETPARAYEVLAGDKFAVATYMITPLGSSLVKGNLVTVADGKYVEVAAGSDVSANGFVGEIVSTSSRGVLTVATLLVMKNEQL